jgi:CheY-like chemotaxis protein
MAKKILVVDDDGEFVDAVTNLLEAKKFEVISASNGKEGYEKAKKEMPDLIMLDVMMTHKSEGFDAARTLKGDAKTRQIPILMVTGIRKEMNLPFGFEPDSEWLPVQNLLEKPVKPETLLKAVEQGLKK